ncbi:threonine ammonia-lyase [uncultured Cetobacterium sp.]|uniref:threonine ammonia-lyase n=1 Tax=uncultured Cetobacterium sp. TaxID=527638 RepID=UPI0026157FA2|nr:threonine ammonia-lyase [uncultured Cetobacterium sp.]
MNCTFALEDILKANDIIKDSLKRTPVVECPTLGEITGNHVFFKLENLQKTGSFKLRGALNKIASLTDAEKAAGVIASSAGNHAQGVALGAAAQGIKATIVMPATAPLAKIAATRGYGAEVVLEGEVYDDAYNKACEIQKETGATFLHPFDDKFVMAGQGTIGLEILEDIPDVDVVLVPIGGGGIISGIAMAIKSLRPSAKVIGIEAANAASMAEAIKEDKVVEINSKPTIADGIAVRKAGCTTFEVIRECVDEIVTVTEDEIAKAILFLMEKSKVVAEGAGATTVAALLAGKIDVTGKKVCSVISGGNIDINLVARVLNKALILEGRRFVFSIALSDKVGEMAKIVSAITELNANILSLNQSQNNPTLGINAQEARFVLECFDCEHKAKVKAKLEELGYVIY